MPLVAKNVKLDHILQGQSWAAFRRKFSEAVDDINDWDRMFVDVVDLCRLLSLATAEHREEGLLLYASAHGYLHPSQFVKHMLGTFEMEQALAHGLEPIAFFRDVVVPATLRPAIRETIDELHAAAWHLLAKLGVGHFRNTVEALCAWNTNSTSGWYAWSTCAHGVGHGAFLLAAMETGSINRSVYMLSCLPQINFGSMPVPEQLVSVGYGLCEEVPFVLGDCVNGFHHSMAEFISREHWQTNWMHPCDTSRYPGDCFHNTLPYVNNFEVYSSQSHGSWDDTCVDKKFASVDVANACIYALSKAYYLHFDLYANGWTRNASYHSPCPAWYTASSFTMGMALNWNLDAAHQQHTLVTWCDRFDPQVARPSRLANCLLGSRRAILMAGPSPSWLKSARSAVRRRWNMTL